MAVLGAGPAGLMAALCLARRGCRVVVLERGSMVGGMAGSFEVAGVRVDYGSHRLHTSVEPALLAQLRALLGNDLQTRVRRGRLALAGRWMGFPLRVGDIARTMPKPLAARIALDTALAPLRRRRSASAHDVIAARLGPTVAAQFYLPYLTKLWGVPPTDLSSDLADRRVSARSGLAVIRKALRTSGSEGGQFRYPRRGFGQICEAVAGAAADAGASIELSAAVTAIGRVRDGLEISTAGGLRVRAATVLSSLPVAGLARLAGGPHDVLVAAGRLRHRAMVLVYLVLDTDRLSGFDAHYLPSLDTPVSRLSEPKNFRDGDDPEGVTVVCAELACWEGDDTWRATPEQLSDTVMGSLEPFGFRWPRLMATEVRRIPRCYPSYTGTYAADLARIEGWTNGLDRVLTFGRQGLFTPDNTHHALRMGWDAGGVVETDGSIDGPGWARRREAYRDFVVED